MTLRILIATALALPALQAQDGGQLYTTYCSACHGLNGEGALNGQFPPLAESPWPAGSPDRAIKIVLAGLHGEVEVNDRTWNLEMPPLGIALPDDQIAAILTHVRSSWGNKAGAVDAAKVKAVRASIASRSQPWTAAEILKLHPLDLKPPVADLLSYVYDGSWKSTPDFASLKPAASEEENDGIISLSKVGRKLHYGVVWEGTLDLPFDSDYEFHFDADDGGRLLLDGKKLAEVTGVGPIESRAQEVSANFTKGPHKLRVEYYQFEGTIEIRVAWRKKGEKNWHWLSDHKGAARSKYPEIPIVASGGVPAVYRNFIQGSTARGIGIGFPGGINFVWSADHLAPELIWQGAFMSGGHHWTERGQGFEPPAGDHVVKLSGAAALPAGAKFLGYQFGKDGRTTFAVSIGNQKLVDSYLPAPPTGPPTLTRTLTLTGEGAPLDLLVGDHGFPGSALLTSSGPAIETKDGKSTLHLTPGQPVTLSYRWK